VRYARGEATIGEQRNAFSIIGSHFNVSFRETTVVAGRPAVKARICGRAWIHGIHQIGVDPSDPFPQGFLLSDCWGDAFDLLQ
jgi:proline racemase